MSDREWEEDTRAFLSLEASSDNNGHGNGGENFPQKVNSRCLKIDRCYSNSFNLTNVFDIFRSWILKDCI